MQSPFVIDANAPDGDWQAEAARSRTSGIEIEDGTFIFDQRLMSVAEDDGGESCHLRLQIEGFAVMQDVKSPAPEFDRFC